MLALCLFSENGCCSRLNTEQGGWNCGFGPQIGTSTAQGVGSPPRAITIVCSFSGVATGRRDNTTTRHHNSTTTTRQHGNTTTQPHDNTTLRQLDNKPPPALPLLHDGELRRVVLRAAPDRHGLPPVPGLHAVGGGRPDRCQPPSGDAIRPGLGRPPAPSTSSPST